MRRHPDDCQEPGPGQQVWCGGGPQYQGAPGEANKYKFVIEISSPGLFNETLCFQFSIIDAV